MGLAQGDVKNTEDGALCKPEPAISSSPPKGSRQAALPGLEKLDPSTKVLSESDSEQPRQAVAAVSADEYPTGLRLVLLAGASIMGVFLISLDQVCRGANCFFFCAARRSHHAIDYRRHGDSQDHGRVWRLE